MKMWGCCLRRAVYGVFVGGFVWTHGHASAQPEDALWREAPANSPVERSAGDLASAPPQATLSADMLCVAIGQEAAANDLPPAFFTRLIWQESRFDPRARSHKGAEGIAQFMPGTSRWRGLSDAYDPLSALRESAKWLGELREQFGNLGLAAAAYNAGPGRVRSWLDGKGALPSETRNYVSLITGRSAEEWSKRTADDARETAPKSIPCLEIARLFVGSGARRRAIPRDEDETQWGPWGLQLAGAWSQAQAIAAYRRLQGRFAVLLADRKPMIVKSRMPGRGAATWYRIRVAESTRDKAHQLCSRLSAAGGSCLVMRN